MLISPSKYDETNLTSGLDDIKLVLCSKDLSMEFQLLIKIKIMGVFLAFKHSEIEFILLINVKMPPIVALYLYELDRGARTVLMEDFPRNG